MSQVLHFRFLFNDDSDDDEDVVEIAAENRDVEHVIKQIFAEHGEAYINQKHNFADAVESDLYILPPGSTKASPNKEYLTSVPADAGTSSKAPVIVLVDLHMRVYFHFLFLSEDGREDLSERHDVVVKGNEVSSLKIAILADAGFRSLLAKHAGLDADKLTQMHLRIFQPHTDLRGLKDSSRRIKIDVDDPKWGTRSTPLVVTTGKIEAEAKTRQY